MASLPPIHTTLGVYELGVLLSCVYVVHKRSFRVSKADMNKPRWRQLSPVFPILSTVL